MNVASGAEVTLQAVLNRLPVSLSRAFHFASLLFREKIMSQQQTSDIIATYAAFTHTFLTSDFAMNWSRLW
jgi:cytochrome c oxidase assembly factor CtaG